MRILLTIFALTFAAGLLFTLYHIGYVAPQELSEVFIAQASPAQQQAEANQVIKKIFTFVSVELVVALLLVIILAIYVNQSKKANIIYVERANDEHRKDNQQAQVQVSTDEYVIEQFKRQINELVQQADPEKLPDKELIGQLLSRICHATDAVAGACFVCDYHCQTIQGVASFALSQPLSSEPLAYGEGFVGQVAQSGKLLYLHPVPANYLPIKTGLGKAQPASLVYLPVQQRGHTVGVIELAMFKQLSENLLENLQKNIHLSGLLFSNNNMQGNSSTVSKSQN